MSAMLGLHTTVFVPAILSWIVEKYAGVQLASSNRSRYPWAMPI